VNIERTVSVALAGYGITTFGYALLWSFRRGSIQYIPLTCGVGIILISLSEIKKKRRAFNYGKYKSIAIIGIITVNFLFFIREIL